MFGLGSFDDLYYPMTADIYYSTTSQNDFGEMIKTWNRDRSVICSAIKENPDSRIPKFLETNKNLEYDITINFRTNEDISLSADLTVYKPNDIVISNIKDSSGNLVWKESYETATVFEIYSIEPMFDMFMNTAGYRIYLTRSDSQDIL